MTLETGSGVTEEVWRSETVIIWSLVTGAGVILTTAVTFEVISLVVVLKDP